MLNSGKKTNILTLALFEKKILNESKNHNPPLQVKWSVPYFLFILFFSYKIFGKTMYIEIIGLQ